MPDYLVGKGTWLNTATVLAGGFLGLLVGRSVPPHFERAVLSGLGLVTIGLGIKLFLGSKNIMILAAATAIGGIIGTLFGIDAGLSHFAEWAKGVFGGDESSTFTEGVITASVLFCVGPMTLMGCLQEAVERKIELIGIKSTLDGFSAFFLTVALGPGVLVSALVVFVIQGLLTVLGSKLEPLANDERLIAEASGAGGPMMLAIGLSLLNILKLPVANYAPALLLAPMFVWLGGVIARRRGSANASGSSST